MSPRPGSRSSALPAGRWPSGSATRSAGSRSRMPAVTATASGSRRRPACRKRSWSPSRGPSTGCWRAGRGHTGRSWRSIRLAAGASRPVSSRMPWSGSPSGARSSGASSGRTGRSASGATRRCCGSSGGGRWRGSGGRWSPSSRPRSGGSCRRGRGSRRSGSRCGAARDGRPGAPGRGRRPAVRRRDPGLGARARRPAGPDPGPPAAPLDELGASARWPGSGGGALGETTGGSSSGGPGEGLRRAADRRRRATVGARHEAIRAHLASRGASFYRDLHAAAGGGMDRDVLDALWDLVWAGEVTNDTFAPLRALRWKRPARSTARPRAGRLTALGPPEAAGRWSLVDLERVRRQPHGAAPRHGPGPPRSLRRPRPRGGHGRGHRRRASPASTRCSGHSRMPAGSGAATSSRGSARPSSRWPARSTGSAPSATRRRLAAARPRSTSSRPRTRRTRTVPRSPGRAGATTIGGRCRGRRRVGGPRRRRGRALRGARRQDAPDAAGVRRRRCGRGRHPGPPPAHR